MRLANGYLYFLTTILIASPALATLAGIPRPDTVLAPLNVVVFLLVLLRRPLPRAIAAIGVGFLVVLGFALLTILPPSSMEAVPDVLQVTIPALLLVLVHRKLAEATDPDQAARHLLGFAALLIGLPVLVEVATGIHFVSGQESFGDQATSIFRGTFFNPNDMAACAAMVLVALCHFFVVRPAPPRVRMAGVGLLALTGFAVFVGGSRAATLIGVMAVSAAVFVVASGAVRVLVAIASATLLTLVSDLDWLDRMLRALEQVPLFARTAERLHLAIFAFSDDRSISYRNDIYGYFVDHFQLLPVGYGPRNYGAFFGGGLNYDLAATNPHSFPIEAYLAFGLFGAAGYLVVLAALVACLWRSPQALRVRGFGLIALAAFVGLSFVPSSILRISALWLPLMTIAAAAVVARSRARSQDLGRARDGAANGAQLPTARRYAD